MNISGFDHMFISQKSIFELKESIIQEVTKKWPECVIDVEEDKNMMWLFFAKNMKMFEDEERSYDLTESGEGCFSIIANRLSGFNSTVALQDAERIICSEVKIILNDFWSYTLVLPERVDYNWFTRSIYDLLIGILSINVIVSRPEHQNALIPRPSQDFL